MLGKAARDAMTKLAKKVVVVVVASLSNRMFTEHIDPADDRIHSAKDDEWNQKILEFFADGRLEDISQLSRDIQSQIRVSKVVAYKPAWWMAATMGQHNNYHGEVLAYEALHGAGGAVIQLTPAKEVWETRNSMKTMWSTTMAIVMFWTRVIVMSDGPFIDAGPSAVGAYPASAQGRRFAVCQWNGP